MKRHIFSILFIIITSFCAFSQDEINLSRENSQVTSILPSGSSSENTTDPFYESSILSTTAVSSRYDGNSTMTFDYKKTQEWGKYRALRAVGWSALGVGVPVTLTGLYGMAIEYVHSGNGINGPFFIVTLVGGALTLSSIPILISAYHYRNKAKKIALNVGVTSINTHTFSNRIDYTPALSFALTF